MFIASGYWRGKHNLGIGAIKPSFTERFRGMHSVIFSPKRLARGTWNADCGIGVAQIAKLGGAGRPPAGGLQR